MADGMNEAVQKIEEKTKEFVQDANLEAQIKDNKIEFSIGETKYRASKPSFEQKLKASQARTKKLIELMRDTSNLMEKDMIEMYESRGISIKEMDLKYNDLQTQRKEISLKLGKALAENQQEADLKPLRNDLEAIILEQNRLMMQRTVLMEGTIEAQLNLFAYTYLASLIVDRLAVADGAWVPAWASYEEFIKLDEDTINTVVWHSSLVSKNELPNM